jgi:diphthine-ammonia ligase
MIDSGIEAVLVKVAALGLEPHKHLGKSLQQVRSSKNRYEKH